MCETPDIPGAAEVVAWYGHWPSFHDAEVLSITLNRAGGSRIAIHTRSGNKDGLVTFYLEGFPLDPEGITKIRIEAFNHQNVLSGATVNKTAGGIELNLDSCFGVDASIVCERLSVTVEPPPAG